MEINIAFLFVIAGLALMIGFKNSRIQYLKEERDHYKKVSEKLEEDINNLTQGK
jgi:hypothetical protein